MCAIIRSRVPFTGSIDTQSGRTVGQYHGGNAQRVERIGGTCGTWHEILCSSDDGIVTAKAFHTRTDDKVRLVLERQFTNHFLLVDGLLGHFISRCTADHHCGRCYNK